MKNSSVLYIDLIILLLSQWCYVRQTQRIILLVVLIFWREREGGIVSGPQFNSIVLVKLSSPAHRRHLYEECCDEKVLISV